MTQPLDFRRATRRVLFKPSKDREQIPGEGRSAAEGAKRHTKVKVTMNLDGHVVEHFKELARSRGRAYQSLVNEVLRNYVAGSNGAVVPQLGAALLADEEFLAQLGKALAALNESKG